MYTLIHRNDSIIFLLTDLPSNKKKTPDAEGHTLDIWLRKQRDNHSAYAFIKRLIKQFGKPQKVITDQAPSTKVAMAKVIKAFKLKPDCHCTSKYLNNLIEQNHRHIKVRKGIKVSIQQRIL